jgi:phospholipase/carboxylesterase
MGKSEPRRRKIGPLECIEVHVADNAPTVVMFHGYGADAQDLSPLAQVVKSGQPTNWIFPNGHQSVEIGGGLTGRAWFPLRLAELEQAIAQGKGVDLTTVVPPGMKKAREMALEMLEKLGRPMNRIVLGGFSQGSMLAVETSLAAKDAPAGLIILSGTLVDRENIKTRAQQRKLRFFQSHGTHDSVLRVDPAMQLEKILLEAGWKGRLIEFDGQHEIPPEVLIQLGQYLREVLPKT